MKRKLSIRTHNCEAHGGSDEHRRPDAQQSAAELRSTPMAAGGVSTRGRGEGDWHEVKCSAGLNTLSLAVTMSTHPPPPPCLTNRPSQHDVAKEPTVVSYLGEYCCSHPPPTASPKATMLLHAMPVVSHTHVQTYMHHETCTT